METAITAKSLFCNKHFNNYLIFTVNLSKMASSSAQVCVNRRFFSKCVKYFLHLKTKIISLRVCVLLQSVVINYWVYNKSRVWFQTLVKVKKIFLNAPAELRKDIS